MKSKYFSTDFNNKNPVSGKYDHPGPLRLMKHKMDRGFVMKKSGILIGIGTRPYNKPKRLVFIEISDGPVK